MDTTSILKKSILDWITRGSFFLLIVLVPLFFSLQLTTYTLPKVVLSQVLACILLSAWFMKMTLRGQVLFKPSMLFYPILVYFVISVFSLFQAMSPPGVVSLLWQVFAYIIIYFIVINCFEEKEIGTWVLIMTLVGFLMSVYGLLQYFGIEPLLKDYHYVPRIPYSTLGHRNQVAQYLVLLIPLSGVFFFLTSSWTRRVVLRGHHGDDGLSPVSYKEPGRIFGVSRCSLDFRRNRNLSVVLEALLLPAEEMAFPPLPLPAGHDAHPLFCLSDASDTEGESPPILSDTIFTPSTDQR